MAYNSDFVSNAYLFLIRTGKSALLTAAIAATVADGERVRACAPSNRALHSLCNMFMAKHPTVAVALVGNVDALLQHRLDPLICRLIWSLCTAGLHAWLHDLPRVLRPLQLRN